MMGEIEIVCVSDVIVLTERLKEMVGVAVLGMSMNVSMGINRGAKESSRERERERE